MFLIALTLFTFVDAVYFTTRNLQITVPFAKNKPPSLSSPLVTFQAIGQAPLNFSISPSKFLKITSSGDVFLTEQFLDSDVESLDRISGVIRVQDNTRKETEASLLLDVRPIPSLDCDLFLEDLCFWKEGQYQIEENTKPSFLSALSSPLLGEMCPLYDIKYSVLSKSETFRARLKGKNRFIESTRVLDREAKAKYNLEVLCTVENPKHSTWTYTRNLTIFVLDVDDNTPQAQEKHIEINMSSRTIQKDHTVMHKELIFMDRDSIAVNRYKPTILNDPLKILKANCTPLEDDRPNFPESGTVIYCKMVFVKNVSVKRWTYPVILQLKDVNFVGANKTASVPVEFNFLNRSGFHPALIRQPLPKPILYHSNSVKIFRTAAPLARLTQPFPESLNGARNFTIKTRNPKLEDIFAVTQEGGIVFVHNSAKLRDAPEYLRLNISWRYKNNTEKKDEIEIEVIKEPTETCLGVLAIDQWSFCAYHGTPSECLSAEACAIGTGGANSVEGREGPQRCMWRGDRKPSNVATPLYATCTPDKKYCPDQICDELERLHFELCPQDCTDSVLVPAAEKNNKTNLGVVKGIGVCTCTALQCQCNPKEFYYTETTSTILPEVETFKSNVSRTLPGKILGIELAKCGATCAFGIVAGILFLVGAVTLVVICWRLDRVNKATRAKSDENQDMSVPLSDYIDRSHPDALPLSFEMTTNLADTAIFSIINKYAPDPNWEFPRGQLIIEQTLGEGEFGKVLRAKAFNISGVSGQTTVAVKTLKDDARESELNDLLSEYQLLKEVSHPNVIRLLGVCTAPGGPIYLIIEFAEHGSLRNYLRRSRHLKSECGRLPSSSVDETDIHYDEPNISKVTPKEILSFAWQICKGMAYLSEIKLVHRDLAARNVLLAADKICKISDFGLTRDIYEDDAYFKRSKGRVPVKWMAPESLSDHVYTNKSDIWSFGILVWELVTLGATPYPGIAVQNLFHLLRQGYRMERPDNCSSALYNIMRSCWEINPEHRPTFSHLSTLWEKMLSDEVEYLDLGNNAIHNRSYFCSPFDSSQSETSEKSENNALNYLSRSQSYVKCGSVDKLPESLNILNEPDNNQNDINTKGYETPVKMPKVQTPTNDKPDYYTEMVLGEKN